MVLNSNQRKKKWVELSQNYVHTSACEGLPRMLTTIMDKSLGTLQYFWEFSKSHCPTPPFTPQTMLDAHMKNFFRVSVLYRVGWGRAARKFWLLSFIIINFVFRGPLGRILHGNWCHPLKITVIIINRTKNLCVQAKQFTAGAHHPLDSSPSSVFCYCFAFSHKSGFG